MTLSVLILDDEEDVRRELGDFLRMRKHRIFAAATSVEAFSLLAEHAIDVAVLDVKLPGMDGFSVLEKVKAEYPSIEVIMITGHGDPQSVLHALRLGAFDFFHKPFAPEDIENAFKRTRNYLALKTQAERLTREVRARTDEVKKRITEIRGTSSGIRAVIDLAMKAAATPSSSILITGESGTGKELIARAIHDASDRKDGPFYTLNCSALPPGLVESELFGHKKGAFTGADEDRIGCFESANSGTLFLDEIGDMPLEAQAKLLRVLEERMIKRVGDRRDIMIDVRVIAATNKDIDGCVATGLFRQDLFYRINTVLIALPPLRERPGDIVPLAEFFIGQFAASFKRSAPAIDADAAGALSRYRFPGNIRELRNMVERALIVCAGDTLMREHFYMPQTQGNAALPDERPVWDLDTVERSTIEKALRFTSGNQTNAAKLLGLTGSTLSRKIQKYGISIE